MGLQIDSKLLNYWVNYIDDDLGAFDDKAKSIEGLQKLVDAKMLKYFTIDNTGIFVYMMADNFRGNVILAEMMFYIMPEYRGSLKLVKKYIDEAEEIAVGNSCKRIVIGGNINYKDQSFLKLLRRWGYNDDTVSKIL